MIAATRRAGSGVEVLGGPGIESGGRNHGATRGLGRAMAAEFARLGHIVLGCGGSVNAIRSRSSNLLSPDEWARVAVSFLLGIGTKDSGKPLTVPGQWGEIEVSYRPVM